MSLGQRIKKARIEKGLTQGELANLCGIRQQMVSNLERDIANKSAHIVTFAKILQVDPEWLNGIKEEQGTYRTKRSSKLATVLNFLQENCLNELQSLTVDEQIHFIAHCLKQVHRTKRKADYPKVLATCLKKL